MTGNFALRIVMRGALHGHPCNKGKGAGQTEIPNLNKLRLKNIRSNMRVQSFLHH